MKKSFILILLPVVMILMLFGCGKSQKMNNTKVETTKEAAKEFTLSFDSFDGGGPEYSVFIVNEEIASYNKRVEYAKPNHDEIDGAGYTVYFDFYAKKAGSTGVLVKGDSPVAPEPDRYYLITVDNDLNIDIKETDVNNTIKPVDNTAVLVLHIGDKVLYANLENNSSAGALVDKLSKEPLELNLSDYGGFEKVGDLPYSLPTNDENITTNPGDIILYQGNKITIYYGENTWNFTKLAAIGNTSREELLSLLGEGDVTVSFEIEWTE